MFRIVCYLFIAYIIFNQYIIRGYEEQIDKSGKVIENLIYTCTNLKGDQLDQIENTKYE